MDMNLGLGLGLKFGGARTEALGINRRAAALPLPRGGG